jgi:hypothetical protein
MRSLLVALLFAVLVPLAAQASSNGVARNGCSTGSCHAKKASAGVSVSVSGPAQLAVGDTGTYTLTVVDPGSFAGGGFSVSASGGGSVSVVDPNTVQVNGNVSHSAAHTGVWSYNFNVTAPGVVGASINITFAALAFDGDGSATTADIWNTGSYVVSVISAVPEPATGLLVSLGIGMLAVAGHRRKA